MRELLIEEAGAEPKRLQQKLQGILNPAVMGGISNYELVSALRATLLRAKSLTVHSESKRLFANLGSIVNLGP